MENKYINHMLKEKFFLSKVLNIFLICFCFSALNYNSQISYTNDCSSTSGTTKSRFSASSGAWRANIYSNYPTCYIYDNVGTSLGGQNSISFNFKY